MTAKPIAYDQPIANFIAGLDATGHVTHRSYTKKSVTFHHNGGRLSLQGILDVWKTRRASAHFQSDAAGRIGQYVGVYEYAWATGNTTGNIESISIEMADKTLAPDWIVDPVTWRSAARLAGWLFANVIKAAPTKSNVFVHHHWKSTDCAGPYIDRIFNDLLLEVQTWYAYFTKPAAPAGEELSMSDVQKILDYQKACTIQIQNNTRQLLNNAVGTILSGVQKNAVAVNTFTRQTDATSDAERQAALDSMKAELLSELNKVNDADPVVDAVPPVPQQ